MKHFEGKKPEGTPFIGRDQCYGPLPFPQRLFNPPHGSSATGRPRTSPSCGGIKQVAPPFFLFPLLPYPFPSLPCPPRPFTIRCTLVRSVSPITPEPDAFLFPSDPVVGPLFSRGSVSRLDAQRSSFPSSRFFNQRLGLPLHQGTKVASLFIPKGGTLPPLFPLVENKARGPNELGDLRVLIFKGQKAATSSSPFSSPPSSGYQKRGREAGQQSGLSSVLEGVDYEVSMVFSSSDLPPIALEMEAREGDRPFALFRSRGTL